MGMGVGCALVFASEAKIDIEAKILFRKGMISLVSHRSENSKKLQTAKMNGK
jgi:hypothetical protein